MQLLSLLSSATPAAPAIQVRAGTAPAVPLAGFGLLIDGLVRPLEPVTARPSMPGDAAPQGQAPDDAVLAGLMQAMGLAAPVASPPPPVPTTISVVPGDGGAEVATAPIPSGLAPAAPPAVAGAVLPTVAAPQMGAPAPAIGPVPVPVQAGANLTPTPVVSTGPQAPATPDGGAEIIVTPPVPVIAAGTVPTELQAMAVAQAGAVALPVAKPVESKPVPATDIATSRLAPRLRTSPATSTNATPAPTALAGDAKPAALRVAMGEVTTGGGEVQPATTQAAPTSDNFSLLAATGSTQTISRDFTAHAVAGARPVVAPHATPGLQLVGRIEQAVAQEQTTLTVQLDPEHLGRVEVKLDMQDGRVTAMIAAERPATLDLLQRDARLIERALQQGGMQVQPDGLQFTLREGASQWGHADQGRRGAQLYGQQAQADPAADPLAAPAAFRTDSLVDIQI